MDTNRFSQAARARPRVQRKCKECGTKFVGREVAQYCSDYCRVKAWRKRQT